MRAEAVLSSSRACRGARGTLAKRLMQGAPSLRRARASTPRTHRRGGGVHGIAGRGDGGGCGRPAALNRRPRALKQPPRAAAAAHARRRRPTPLP
jgi:hypothetical protein